MTRNDRQGILITQRPMPAVHVGAAKRRRGNFDQQRSRIEVGDLHLLNGQRFIMFGYDSGVASFHGITFRASELTLGTFGIDGTIKTVP